MKAIVHKSITVPAQYINVSFPPIGLTVIGLATIAIDLDGVLNNYTKYEEGFIPEINDGAKEFVSKLSKKYNLILFKKKFDI